MRAEWKTSSGRPQPPSPIRSAFPIPSASVPLDFQAPHDPPPPLPPSPRYAPRRSLSLRPKAPARPCAALARVPARSPSPPPRHLAIQRSQRPRSRGACGAARTPPASSNRRDAEHARWASDRAPRARQRAARAARDASTRRWIAGRPPRAPAPTETRTSSTSRRLGLFLRSRIARETSFFW